MEQNGFTLGTPVITPAGGAAQTGTTDQDLRQTMEDAAKAVQSIMDEFPDEEEVNEEEAKKAKGFLNSFMDYVKGNHFKQDVMETSRKYKIPPKKVARGFFSSCLGTVGDILGIAISTVGNVADTLISILAAVAHGAVGMIVKVANGLASIVTMNKTCVQTA